MGKIPGHCTTLLENLTWMQVPMDYEGQLVDERPSPLHTLAFSSVLVEVSSSPIHARQP
jgi:hypothetical protein